MAEERFGDAFELEEKLTVVGRPLAAGDPAPEFSLDRFEPETGSMRQIHLSDTAGKVRLLNVINSIDTPVCHIETHTWDRMRSELPDGVEVLTVSMDLPYAQARWQQAEGVDHPALSAHRGEEFGRDYGVLIKEWRLLQRAVFVVDGDGRIVHAEYVADQMAEPDYDTAVEAARAAAERSGAG
jgi:thioredoxin-dependent peroxiredoxin